MKTLIIVVFSSILPAILSDSCYDGSYVNPKGPWGKCSGFTTCEKGTFCINGIKESCPAGTYGETDGLTSNVCSGLCPAGYFCPEGSVSPTPCGNSSQYCPEGSSQPRPIPSGYFGIGKDRNLHFDIIICPKGTYCMDGFKHVCQPGSYGDTVGLSTESCSAPCPAGYYCPTGSSDARAHPCSSSPEFYCPEGSSRELRGKYGYYSIDYHHKDGAGYGEQELCPKGSYCVDGVRHLCPAGHYGAMQQMTNQSCSGLCRPGWYCPAGPICFLLFLLQNYTWFYLFIAYYLL